MESRADRAYRCADRTCNFLHREVAVVAKDDGDAVIGTEGRERAAEGIAVVDAEMGVMRGSRRSCSIQIVVASDLAATEPIAAGVDEDSGEPGVEPIGIAEPAMLLPSSNERVVGRIFRLLCVSEDEASQPLGIVEACLDELLERGSASASASAASVRPALLSSPSDSGPSPVPTHQAPETFNGDPAKVGVSLAPRRRRARAYRSWKPRGLARQRMTTTDGDPARVGPGGICRATTRSSRSPRARQSRSASERSLPCRHSSAARSASASVTSTTVSPNEARRRPTMSAGAPCWRDFWSTSDQFAAPTIPVHQQRLGVIGPRLVLEPGQDDRCVDHRHHPPPPDSRAASARRSAISSSRMLNLDAREDRT